MDGMRRVEVEFDGVLSKLPLESPVCDNYLNSDWRLMVNLPGTKPVSDAVETVATRVTTG